LIILSHTDEKLYLRRPTLKINKVHPSHKRLEGILYATIGSHHQNLSLNLLASAKAIMPTSAARYANNVANAFDELTKMVCMLMFTNPVSKFACQSLEKPSAFGSLVQNLRLKQIWKKCASTYQQERR
jgi:hypothetical protein